MKIKILSSALKDLYAGREFYDKQVEGIGEYFFDALFADIDSLALYAGIHSKFFGYHGLLGSGFLTRFTTKWKIQRPWSCKGSWIFVNIHRRLEPPWHRE